MGTLRTMFALVVLISHMPHATWVGSIGGVNAVRMFYIISGFLISYVLVECKSYKTKRSFYINRYLRLFPIFIVVSVISLLGKLLHSSPTFFGVYNEAPFGSIALLIFSNIFILGQDWIMFLGVQDHVTVFTTFYSNSEVVLNNGLLIPQAWTLGVELSFYIIAPFILTSKRLIISIIAISLALRAVLFSVNLSDDPWSYRFFPCELALFLMGALSHQILLPFYKAHLSEAKLRIYAVLCTVFFVLLTAGYGLIPIASRIKTVSLGCLFVAMLPFLMIFQNYYKFDKRIGELSYPLYICHIVCISATKILCDIFGIDNPWIVLFLAILSALCFAEALNLCIAVPFEAIRRRIKAG